MVPLHKLHDKPRSYQLRCACRTPEAGRWRQPRLPNLISGRWAQPSGALWVAMRRLNVIGRMVAKLRFERGWTQDTVVARMQCRGVVITRDVLASIETGRTKATDLHLLGLQRAFDVQIICFFPDEIQKLDAAIALRNARKPRRRRQ